MKKYLVLALALSISSLAVALPVLAQEMAEPSVSGVHAIHVLIQIATLILVGGVLYNLWVSATGFGGLIGSGLKYLGIGVIFMILDTLDSALEMLTGFGSELVFGQNHVLFHSTLILVGFLFLALGLAKLTKIVKSTKG